MTGRSRPENERWVELMSGRVLDELTREEQRELDELSTREARPQDGSFELAATAIDLAFTPKALTPMPAHLEDRILASFRDVRANAAPAQTTSQNRSEAPAVAPRTAVPTIYKLGWLAAAACFIAAVVAWWPSAPQPQADMFARVDRQADLITPAWTFNQAGGADPRFANVSGEVHWSTLVQRGYTEFVGLPINDPTRQQYQLWIVDPDRDAEPVDGGVFDVTETGRVRVPIDAKLRVVRPTVFALTVEKPGGVVVSEGPLHLVAAVRS